MVHLRIIAPPERTAGVVALLTDDPAVCSVIVLPGAASQPQGDVVMADVAREDTSIVVSGLRELGIVEHGAISIERVDTAIGRRASRAMADARGEEADAVIWEEVESRTSEEASFSWSYGAFMLLAAAIGVCGLFTDNPILIVGAMVVSPEFGPLAGVCVGLVTKRRVLAVRSLAALVLGFAAAIAVAYLLSEALLATGAANSGFRPDESTFASLIASPDAFSVIVAFCAGAAGTLSLTTAKSGALIGVLISVTTIPAACDVAVSAATGDWVSMRGSALQLGVNVVTIIFAGSLTLYLQRLAYLRRRRARARTAPAS